MHDSFRTIQQLLNIESHQRGWHHAEIGERGVAPADVGRIQKDTSEFVFRRHLLHQGSRVRDSDEAFPGIFLTLTDLVVPVLVENQRLGRCTRFRRDDEKTLCDVDLICYVAEGVRVS